MVTMRKGAATVPFMVAARIDSVVESCRPRLVPGCQGRPAADLLHGPRAQKLNRISVLGRSSVLGVAGMEQVVPALGQLVQDMLVFGSDRRAQSSSDGPGVLTGLLG